jgi:hypothetical protein
VRLCQGKAEYELIPYRLEVCGKKSQGRTFFDLPQRHSIFTCCKVYQFWRNDVHRKIAITITALSLSGCLILTSPPASAQSDQHQQEHGKAQGQSHGGNAGAPRSGGGNAGAPSGSARTFTPSAPRTTTSSTTRTYNPQATRTKITPQVTHTYNTQATRTRVTPQTHRTKVTPQATRTKVTPKIVGQKTAPKIVTPRGVNAHVVTTGRLRNMPVRRAGWTTIRGQNYSVWRSGYRVRHRNGWSTFVALSALSALAIGANYYFPYAYISAPQPYCEGLTEDGCQLMWQQVQTLEGDLIYQCVAYCPWQ